MSTTSRSARFLTGSCQPTRCPTAYASPFFGYAVSELLLYKPLIDQGGIGCVNFPASVSTRCALGGARCADEDKGASGSHGEKGMDNGPSTLGPSAAIK